MSHLPLHDGGKVEPVPHEIVKIWNEGTFVENIAINDQGDIFCTAHPGEVFRIHDGACDVFVTVPEAPNGIVFDGEGAMWIGTGAGFGDPIPNNVWRVGADGVPEHWVEIEEAKFLNGMALHPDGRVVVVDSFSGGIYAIDNSQKTWSLWYRSDALKPEPGVRGPGANGIKFHDGAAYVSVTNKALLLKLQLDDAGEITDVVIFAEELLVDDFIIDADGTFYLTTHPYNTLVRLSADGTNRRTIAGPEQGMVGSTACAFGRRAGDENGLYVTADGGMINPLDGALQPAKLVRLDIGQC